MRGDARCWKSPIKPTFWSRRAINIPSRTSPIRTCTATSIPTTRCRAFPSTTAGCRWACRRTSGSRIPPSATASSRWSRTAWSRSLSSTSCSPGSAGPTASSARPSSSSTARRIARPSASARSWACASRRSPPGSGPAARTSSWCGIWASRRRVYWFRAATTTSSRR